MNVVVTGSTGLVGSALVRRLRAKGDRVGQLVRREPQSPDEYRWSPEEGSLDARALDGADAVVHLAGESIGARRWTQTQKDKIRASRISGTRTVAQTLAGRPDRPAVLVTASAIGYYGDRGDQVLDELSSAGEGFLPDLCRDWEAAAEIASAAGVRVVPLRFGMILSPNGGALAKMLPAFRWGLGGRIGNGQQFWSWVSLDDAVEAIRFAITQPNLSGPVNAVSPEPVPCIHFVRTLAHVLRRPCIFPLPARVARIMLGQMADALLLASARVVPSRLTAAGYSFHDPKLEPALTDLVHRWS